MALEERIKADLKKLNIYSESLNPVINQLAVLEREQAETRSEWKKTVDSWRSIKEARREAKEAEKRIEASDISTDAEAWKEAAGAWQAAAEAWQTAAEQWKEHPLSNSVYAAILQQAKQILSLREKIGLTPKALKQIKQDPGEDPETDKTTLEMIIEKRRAAGRQAGKNEP